MIETLTRILTLNILNNPIYKIILSILILLSFFLLNKIFKIIFKNYLLKISKQSKTNIDDILFNSITPSFSMFLFATLFYISYNIINLNLKTLSILEKIKALLFIIPLVYFMIKFVTEFFSFYIKGNSNIKKRVGETALDLLISIIRIILIIIGILMILSNLGYNVSALMTGLGIGGLAFALAAQDIIKNFFSGITLIFDQTFKKGDIIEIKGETGYIKELKLRNTKIETYSGTILTIPNSHLSDNITENLSKAKKVKVSQKFGLTYQTSTEKLKQAKKIIEKAILEDQDTDKENYWVYFDSFSDFSLDIIVLYYGMMNHNNWPEKILFKERVNFKIKEEFEKAKIEFAFPTQTIELKK